jgi:hypothetical protein
MSYVTARALGNDSDRASARDLFAEGQGLWDAARFAEAEAKFAAAYAASPHPEALRAVAAAQIRQYKNLAATASYQRYLAESSDASGRAIVERALARLRTDPPRATITPVTQLQTLLVSKGFGPLTIDGKWGPNTDRGLGRATREASQSPHGVQSPLGARDVPVHSWLLADIRALPSQSSSGATHSSPGGSAPGNQPAPRGRIIIGPHLDPPRDEARPSSGGDSEWPIWAAVGGGVLVVGGVIAWAMRSKRRVVANRRRRRGSRRRSRR